MFKSIDKRVQVFCANIKCHAYLKGKLEEYYIIYLYVFILIPILTCKYPVVKSWNNYSEILNNLDGR